MLKTHKPLLIFVLLVSLFSTLSFNSAAFDFEGAIKDTVKDAVKKQIDPQAESTSTTAPATDNTTAATEPASN